MIDEFQQYAGFWDATEDAKLDRQIQLITWGIHVICFLLGLLIGVILW